MCIRDRSTLGRTVLHLLESTDGQIFFDGEDVTHVDAKKLRKLREKMQIIFQDPFSRKSCIRCF